MPLIENPITLTPKIKKSRGSVTMSFYDALRKVSQGKTITRISWGNKDYCLMKDGWLTIYTKGDFHSWIVNDGDMEGNDWVIAKELN